MLQLELNKEIFKKIKSDWLDKDKIVIDNLSGGYPETEYYYRGRYTIIIKPEKLTEVCPQIREMYPKENMTLKIFMEGVIGPKQLSHLERITQMVQIQNIYSINGLAPHIYNFVKVNNLYAQITDFIKGEYCYSRAHQIHNTVHQLALDNYINCSCDVYPSNIIDNQWVDFDGFNFDNFNKYKAGVIEKYKKDTFFGNSNGPYQPFKELGIEGLRDDSRKELFNLDSYDFEGKTVLDIGCSGGYFVNYCAARGARAIGIEAKEKIDTIFEASNIAGFFGAEYYSAQLVHDDLPEFLYRVTGLRKFDYVFFLSVDAHIGFKDYLKDITKGTLFFESNGAKLEDEEREIFSKKLNSMFPSVEHLGYSREGTIRNLFVCKQEVFNDSIK